MSGDFRIYTLLLTVMNGVHEICQETSETFEFRTLNFERKPGIRDTGEEQSGLSADVGSPFRPDGSDQMVQTSSNSDNNGTCSRNPSPCYSFLPCSGYKALFLRRKRALLH